MADGFRVLQMTFVGKDAIHRLKYAENIGKATGWLVVGLLGSGVKQWLDEWLAQLADSAGVLIIWSETYREKFETNLGSALRKEAKAIMERKAADSSFKIYALDPAKKGDDLEGYSSIRSLLKYGELGEKSYVRWNAWANTWKDTSRDPTALLMQITWAAEDAMLRLKYARQIGRVPGWRATDMLDPTVNDAQWLDEWRAQLADSAGVLIIRSETYRVKFESNPRSALRKEARAIMERKEADSSFKVYALDPGNSSQGITSIRGLLLDGKLEEGYLGWNKWVNKWIDARLPTQAPPQEYEHTAVVGGGKDAEKFDGFGVGDVAEQVNVALEDGETAMPTGGDGPYANDHAEALAGFAEAGNEVDVVGHHTQKEPATNEQQEVFEGSGFSNEPPAPAADNSLSLPGNPEQDVLGGFVVESAHPLPPLEPGEEARQAVESYHQHCQSLAGLCGCRLDSQEPCPTRAVTGRDLCGLHACNHAGGCTGAAAPGKSYCKNHACTADECVEPAAPGKLLCRVHTCTAYGCVRPVCKGCHFWSTTEEEACIKPAVPGKLNCADHEHEQSTHSPDEVASIDFCKDHQSMLSEGSSRESVAQMRLDAQLTTDELNVAEPPQARTQTRAGTKFVCLGVIANEKNRPGDRPATCHNDLGAIGTIYKVHEENLPPQPPRLVVSVAWDDGGGSAVVGVPPGAAAGTSNERLVLKPGNYVITPSCNQYKPGDTIAVRNARHDGFDNVSVVERVRHSRYRVKEHDPQSAQREFELDVNASNSYRPVLTQEVGEHGATLRCALVALPSSTWTRTDRARLNF